MTSREIVKNIFTRKNTDGLAFWTGHPSSAIVPVMAREWGIGQDYESIGIYNVG